MADMAEGLDCGADKVAVNKVAIKNGNYNTNYPKIFLPIHMRHILRDRKIVL